MRIPFPERVPIDRVAVFAVFLFLVQSLEHTPLYFSAGCVAFIMIAAVAFNTAGGLTRPSGAYVFFYSVLVVIIGLAFKALVGERADSNLLDPQRTILIYVVGISAMLAAVTLSKRFSRKTGLLQNILKTPEMYRSSIGCIVFGFGGPFLISLLGAVGNKVNSAFTQLNSLLPLAIIIGVIYEIRRSGGKRSINFPVGLVMVGSFLAYGILGFSKQGMLTPFYCWLLAVAAMRYRLSALQVGSCLLGVFIIFQYLVPYSQWGRRFLPVYPSWSQRVDTAIPLLVHIDNTRRQYRLIEDAGYIGPHYFNRAQGFWDRLNFIAVDDSLINLTDQGTVFGLSPIPAMFLNAVPHFIYPNKPMLNYGNAYAHEMDALSEDDVTTGVSFSPTAEAYHLGTWVGVLVVAPLIWFLLFVLYDSLLGDVRATPWGLFSLALISHAAPEMGVTGAIYVITFGAEMLTFCALFATYAAPIFAVAVLGKDRARERRRLLMPTILAPAHRSNTARTQP